MLSGVLAPSAHASEPIRKVAFPVPIAACTEMLHACTCICGGQQISSLHLMRTSILRSSQMIHGDSDRIRFVSKLMPVSIWDRNGERTLGAAARPTTYF